MSVDLTLDQWNERGAERLPGHLGIRVLELGEGFSRLSMEVTPRHLAPNGYLHAGAVVTLADTACGYGCLRTLPEGATGFTTIETKSNHLGTALSGVVEVKATAAHTGRTTQVWDAVVTAQGKTIALFRCTQLVLWPKERR